MLSQNQVNFYTQWGYTDPGAGAEAVSLAIAATGLGKFLTVWIGGEVSDRIGRKKMAVAGGILYILCFAGLLVTKNFAVACACAFIAGVATSGFWDASLYPAAQEAVPKQYSGAALIGIKGFVSISGIIYPLLVVYNNTRGAWKVNVWIPLILSVIVTILAIVASFAYDDKMKSQVKTEDGHVANEAEMEVQAIKDRMLKKPGKSVNLSLIHI